MQLLLHLLPIAVIIAILIFRKHMLFAGFIGAIVAMIIGGISPADAGNTVIDSIKTMFSYVAPILYAAAAMMVSKGGSIQAIVDLAKRGFGKKIAFFAGFLVLIQALATYMAGMGAGNTMVIAPLVMLAVGAIPEVVAGMAIATAVCFTTSPASTETVLAAESAARDVFEHATSMLPVTIIFVVLGAALAVYGVYRKGGLLKKDAGKLAEVREPLDKTGTLFVRAIPAIALLVFVIFSGNLNKLFGIHIFTPVTNILFTAILTAIFTPLKINKTCEALADGSKFILTTLFSVGIFLGFINIIALLGTFEELAALVGSAPQAIVVPCAIIAAFVIAIPSGAFCAGVLTLILPTLSLLGMPSEAMGFVAIAAGLGTQISPVQINIAALADGFQQDIMQVVKSNMKYILGALVLLILLSFIFV
ncbi:MAG: hypothetical protein RR413_02380 [Christensenellaceae bacterium]